jgi:hypothetical protein
MANFHFGPGSFSDELWINVRAVFSKPIGVDVEFIADANGAEVRTPRPSKCDVPRVDGKCAGLSVPSTA